MVIKFFKAIKAMLYAIINDVRLWALALFLIFFILFGGLIYAWLEGWKYIDAVYFCFVTIATIGYGDFTPTTDIGKLFTIVYFIFGFTILTAFVSGIFKITLAQAKEKQVIKHLKNTRNNKRKKTTKTKEKK